MPAVFDSKEVLSLIDASLDFWLTAGRFAHRFEQEFADFWASILRLDKFGIVSQSSCICRVDFSDTGERRIRKGDEVITVAAGFPTTVTPIIQYGAIPVFVDIKLPTYNIDCSRMEKALTKKDQGRDDRPYTGKPF